MLLTQHLNPKPGTELWGQWGNTDWLHVLLRELVLLISHMSDYLKPHMETFQVTFLGLCSVNWVHPRGSLLFCWCETNQVNWSCSIPGTLDAFDCLRMFEPNSFADDFCYLCNWICVFDKLLEVYAIFLNY